MIDDRGYRGDDDGDDDCEEEEYRVENVSQ